MKVTLMTCNKKQLENQGETTKMTKVGGYQVDWKSVNFTEYKHIFKQQLLI